MKTILFVSHDAGTACGGYQFGRRWFNSLRDSDKYRWVCEDVHDLDGFDATYQRWQPSAIVFNFIPIAMGWVAQLNHGVEGRYPVPRITMEHNWSVGLLPQMLTNHYPTFTHLMYSDPTFSVDDSRIFNFTRPLPPSPGPVHMDPNEEVRIGSFGLALPHKNFPLLVQEVNRCFDNAVINFHMTEPTFGPPQLDQIMAECRAQITKTGISIHHTSDFAPDEEVVQRLSENHINALFYRVPDHNSGLSSSTDFFVAAQRPMLFTSCAVFNHVRSVMCQWPDVTFTDMLGNLTCIEDSVHSYYERVNGSIASEAEAMMDQFLQ